MSLLPLAGAGTTVPLAVPLDGATAVEYANLDVAASAPALEAVARAVARALPLYASVHRGAGYLSQVSTALYEQSRTAVGRFAGARTDDVVVITRNTTDSLNLLAGCVPGRVLVLDVEHHANLLPWQRHGADVLTAGRTVAATLDALANALSARRYALVAVTGASNVTGEALPLGPVADAAHAAGARVVVDAAQLAPHRPFSLEATGVDYVAFSGHKVYAPYGAGALVGRRDWLDAGEPYLAGGGAVTDVRVEETVWEPAPQRHEAGSPNVIGAIALGVACTELAQVSHLLAHHEEALRARLVTGLRGIDGVEVLRLWPDAADPVGVVTFTLPGHDAGLVAAYLSAEHGVGVRDGRFCAHPLLTARGIDAGLRASIGIGTTAEHVDRLVRGVADYVSHGPRAAYEVVGGRWQPADDQRELPEALALLRALHADADARSVLATAAAAAGCGPAPTVAGVLAAAAH